jgi:6-phosphogluconolactonase
MSVRRAILSTYSTPNDPGVYSLEMSPETGAITQVSTVTGGKDPSFLAIDRENYTVYVVNEVADGFVRAYNLNPSTGDLTHLNTIRTGLADPCYCLVHPARDVLLVSHFEGAAISILPIDDQGRLDNPTCVVNHSGSSINPHRQQRAHPHSVVPGPDPQFVYVPDLGTDQVVIYSLPSGSDELDKVGCVEMTAGAGPRHLEFHTTREFAYLINELHSTVTVFKWDPQSGNLTEIQEIDAIPHKVSNTSADIHVHPSGDFVYGSNRGHNSIVVYRVLPDGKLDPVKYQSTKGTCPRNLALDPTGKYLYAENQTSDTVVIFTVESPTGSLSPTGDELSVPKPVCLKFV